MAATVKLSAMWLLPVPGGPSSKSPPCSGMNRTVPKSRMSALGICGLNDQSKLSSVLSWGTLAAFSRRVKEPIAASGELVGDQQLEELGVGQVMADGLLVSGQHRLGHA